MSEATNKLTVGQVLWFVPSAPHYGNPREVTVTKVGRKWAEIDTAGIRIGVNTLYADGRGYMSPGQCWTDRTEYEAWTELLNEWDAFRKRVNDCYRMPESVTIEGVRAASKALGFAPGAAAGGAGAGKANG